MHHGKFESLIMILIMLSSFKLVFDTYTESLAKDNPIVSLKGINLSLGNLFIKNGFGLSDMFHNRNAIKDHLIRFCDG